MKIRDYQIADKQSLIAILKLNVPKYFSEADVSDFEEHLDKKLWDYHHIDGDRSNNRPSNCEALCPYCHAEKTRNRK